MLNQTLNSLGDDNHKKKYYNYLISSGLQIVTDIFERMDMDRKIIEALRKLQTMDHLSEEEYYQRKQVLVRKMTAKATKFLYEKEPKLKEITLKEMAALKEKEKVKFDK